MSATSVIPQQAPTDSSSLRCMEIRGGTEEATHRVDTPGLDIWLTSTPHAGSKRGGDVHYISVCGGGYTTRVVLADVSGHGEHVGGLAVSLRNLMREHINTKRQDGFLSRLNRAFGALDATGRFATAIVMTYLANTRAVQLGNAGHPRPFLYRASTNSWSVLGDESVEAANLPFGILDDGDYGSSEFTLDPGDVLVLYTDALIESADASGRLLGEDALLDIFRGLDPSDPEHLGRAALGRVSAHRGGAPADDDSTLIVLRQNGQAERPPGLIEKLDVYAKVFGLKAV